MQAQTTEMTSVQSPMTNTSLPIAQAEPITVFHFEVLAITDHKVAGLTQQLLYASIALIIIAIVNFAIDIGSSGLSLSGAIMNLIIALSLPACGIIGVRDKNITCIQYFCCCTYFCAFLTFISIIGYIVLVASGHVKYTFRLCLVIVFFAVYIKGGHLSQKLQEQPYFTTDRLAPRSSYNVHQNTVEYNPQPTAHAEFVNVTPQEMNGGIPPPAPVIMIDDQIPQNVPMATATLVK